MIGAGSEGAGFSLAYHGQAWLICLLLACTCNRATAEDFFVAPDGNDASPGTVEQPFASVARAQKAVRELKAAQGDRGRPVVVSIRGGRYELSEPIVFGPADSGSAQSPVIYQARGDECPVFSGGRSITGWRVTEPGVWKATLPDVKSGKWSFSQLFVNDQRRFRPRLPKKGYYRVAEALKPSAPDAKGHDRFGYEGDNVDPGWASRDDVELLMFHIWSASRMRIKSVDAERRIVDFRIPTRSMSWWASFPKGHRWLVVNVKEALSEPGEWYLDRSAGELTYLAKPGETPGECVVVAPRLEQLVVFRGDVGKQQWVQHIQLKGLTFAHAGWALGPDGYTMPQAEIGIGEALTAFGGRNLLIERCCLRHLGRWAMGFGPGCRDNRVRGCELWDVGAGGIKVGYAGSGDWTAPRNVPKTDETLASHHTIEDCTIAHLGRLHPAAIGVWIGDCPHNRFVHNDVYDLYYSSVSVGWVWGYGKSRAHHNEIAFNHMHTIGQGILSDMGGVYSLGIQPGTTVHDNHIHHVHSFGYGGWGLYTDEGSTDIKLYNNLVHHTKDGGFDQHYGKNNEIFNNIFAFGIECMIRRNARRDRHTSFDYHNNVVLYDRGFILGGGWALHGDDSYRLDSNLYWHAEGGPVKFRKDMDFEAWRGKHGQDAHSVVADPRFVDARAGDFRLQADSPAITKTGFKPFDYSRAGRITAPVFIDGLPPVPSAFE
jgi:hypothetical protein